MNDAGYCSNNNCPLKDSCNRYILGLNAGKEERWTEGEWNGKFCGIYIGN